MGRLWRTFDGLEVAFRLSPVGAGELPPDSGVAANGKPIFDWDQAAAQLTRINLQWSASQGTSANVTYAFRASATANQFPIGASGFQQFTAAQIVATEAALALWSDVANITFVRVGSGTSGANAYSNNATILFGDFNAGLANSTGFSFYPGSTSFSATQGDVWINLAYAENLNALGEGGFGAHTLEHEIGHAIGLAHPGDYDSTAGGTPTYDRDAIYWQDSRAFTVMSYFGSSSVGYSLGAFSSGPQLHDIAAAQLMYGVNTTTRTGDTVYGFNSNTGYAHYSIADSAGKPVFCIWDAGGNDTLDLSGYATSSQIDLRAESFSGAGPDSTGTATAIGNISIANGVIIENAIGGSGNDTIIGNDVANQLTGGGGDDALTGGLGVDTANYFNASTSNSWHRNPDGSWTVIAGAGGIDTLNSVERAHFTDRDLYLDPAQQSFSGDGMSDILWRRNDGLVATWSMHGATHDGSGNLGAVGLEWTTVGTGDFNGDGKDDIAWLRNDGLAAIWEMNGNAVTLATGVIGGVGTTWHVAGIGDFNTDGKDDLLWKSDGGLYAIWDMNGFTASTKSVIGSVGAEWSVQAVADFNGDGSDDILWRRTDGLVALWNTNGTAQTGSAVVGSVGTDWSIVGTGDFNDDGRADILWQRNDGLTALWEMNGASQLASGVIGSVGTSWHVAGVGDYNGDGMDDIFWRNDAGLLAVWTMNGFSVTSTGITGSVGSEWGII